MWSYASPAEVMQRTSEWSTGGGAPANVQAFETMLDGHPSTDGFCVGNTPTLADICLVPQLYNARRFGIDIADYPTIQRIEKTCLALPAFDAARPERQPDAPQA